MKFCVERGMHAEGGDRKNGVKSHVYRTGEVVDSKTDLASKFGREKFRPVSSRNSVSVPVAIEPDPEEDEDNDPPQPADLDKMTVNELREYAADEEIELSGAIYKTEILQKIRGE